MLSKWCARCGSEWGSLPWSRAVSDDDMLHLLPWLVIGVQFLVVLEGLLEVLFDGKRARQPLVALRVPRISARHFPAHQGVDQVDEDDEESDGEQRGPRR